MGLGTLHLRKVLEDVRSPHLLLASLSDGGRLGLLMLTVSAYGLGLGLLIVGHLGCGVWGSGFIGPK